MATSNFAGLVCKCDVNVTAILGDRAGNGDDFEISFGFKK